MKSVFPALAALYIYHQVRACGYHGEEYQLQPPSLALVLKENNCKKHR